MKIKNLNVKLNNFINAIMMNLRPADIEFLRNTISVATSAIVR